MIHIKVSGLKEVQGAMKRYAEKIPGAGRAGVWNFTQKLAKKLRIAAPRGATGHMKSVGGTYAEKIDKNNYVIKMPIYTKYLEKGTGPAVGRPPYWTNRSKVIMWARMHGFNPYAFRAYIAKEGTKAHPFTARIINQEVKRLKRTVEKEINDTKKKKGR